MNVGLPGTGIGGLFYLVTALLMPAVELLRTIRGRSTIARWRLVAHQVLLALGILLVLWATGWMLNHALPHHALASLRAANTQATHALGVAPTTLTLVTLGGVLLAVEVLRSVCGLLSRLRR